MSGKLLLVIPPVVRLVNAAYEVECDFANNLKAYLSNFNHVTVACSAGLNSADSGILRSVAINQIKGSERLTYIPLPYTYNELQHLRHYLPTVKLLRSEIAKADYLLFSPHAKYDWPTVAALQAIKMKRKYDIESDWVHESVQRLQLDTMRFGPKKVRKTLWMHSFLKDFNKCLAHSQLALLQGQDVFDAYKNVASNAHKVLNVQVAPEDYISNTELEQKLRRIRGGQLLQIAYAGRILPMKGPLDWLKVIHDAVNTGVNLHATWFGDGSLMSEMQHEIRRLGLGDQVSLAGVVGRDSLMTHLRKTDVFLFCHKTGESPRCLGEALAAGCSLIGYGSAYSTELTARHGGGAFTEIGDWQALAAQLRSFNRDREQLGRLIESAAASGKLLNREIAIQNRIDLIKSYLD
jgi:glycosyltransferase involved in cell wall biosynthesis